ncbi:chaplin [Saccharothrix sp. ST-888]|uniref:chaplin n=1 Tax=Saccharothrix sp. ST-888 TaxID=1427391 RepID=UPI0009E217DE|nr:chaplin [Saccharothrix sp. ST-888]
MRKLTYGAFGSAAAVALLLGGAASASATGASATGGAINSAGVLSGNLIQVPLDVPVNICGNTVDVIGLMNPASDNLCANAS